VRLPLAQPPPPAAGFSRLPELEHYCKLCPPTDVYPTLCAGMWLAADIRAHLQWAFRDNHSGGPVVDVAIQFRCGDSHDDPKMGMLPFEYYHAVLRDRITNGTRVSILPDPEAAQSECCMALALALLASLHREFRVSVECRYPTTVGRDFATLMRARTLVGGPSTFALFAAIATEGDAFLPVSSTLMHGQAPCLPNVQWMSVPRYLHGCSASVLDWFLNKTAFPDTSQYLERLLRGPWYTWSLHHFLRRKTTAALNSQPVQTVINHPRVKKAMGTT